MFKVCWNWGDGQHCFALVPDVYAAYALYWVITGYGRADGCTPHRVWVTDLDGHTIDTTQGVRGAANYGTYTRTQR